MSVLLTGFEPFGNHTVNPSWEVMKTLNGRLCGKKQLSAKAYLLPVEYDPVKEKVPSMWETNPDARLCIHCGVGREGQLKLEQRARNSTYQHADNRATFPASKKCFDDAGNIEHRCVLDLESVVKAVKTTEPDTKLGVSDDAGLYLCEFTYFVSLHKGKAPTVFLHVPPFHAPYNPEDLKHKVEMVVDALVDALPDAPAAPEKSRPRVGMAVLLRHADHPGCILVGKRIANHSDGNTFGTNTYAAPGGHLEFGETFEECARREVREECGIAIENVSLSGTVNTIDRDRGYHGVVLIMVADAKSDDAQAMEPEKCAGWEWAPWHDLPQPTFGSLLEVKRAGLDPFANPDCLNVQAGPAEGTPSQCSI